ncbi:MAG: hypothetical protein GEU28_12965 [Dehalococcoidia bacterium]|nr:hypothetical protein [Dehalococcoidia bacterium]
MLVWLDRHRYLLLAVAALMLITALWAGGMADGASRPIEFQTGSRLPDGTPIRVHVTGEVARPGVQEMFEGERVIDAINEAGGPTASADQESLNLARRLRDGEQLVVPSRSSSPQSAGAVAALASGQLLDINTATETELDQLPGIGAAYSRRIVDSRTVDGPFKTVEDLISRRVIPSPTFESIRPLITVSP